MASRKLNTDNALDTPRIEVPGSPNFEPHIDGLLKEGNVPVTDAARSALNISLKLAWLVRVTLASAIRIFVAQHYYDAAS
jgi:hypothetical protein